jgi:mannose-1-phosphate guanylyltransferase
MYALIMAGGVGSRLWPRSRQSKPKQLLNLSGELTMMQATVQRLRPILPPEHIFVVTSAAYVPLIHDQVPDLPMQNLIGEPSGKNTAPAISLGIAQMRHQGIDDVVAVLPADHLIQDEVAFRQALVVAAEVARAGRLVTFGINPTGPATGYGYIQRAAPLGDFHGHDAFEVRRFLEKPSREKAQEFFASGEYYWNSGMFIWQMSRFAAELALNMPDLARQMDQVERVLNQGGTKADFGPIWQEVVAESIDYGLMEKAENVAVVPLSVGWNDVGSWGALLETLTSNSKDNVVLGVEHLALDTSGSLIQGNGKLVATIGLDQVVIIDTDDALLVCARERTQDVKLIVEHLKQSGRTEYL